MEMNKETAQAIGWAVLVLVLVSLALKGLGL